MTTERLAALSAAIAGGTSAEGAAWLTEVLGAARNDPTVALDQFPAVARKVGQKALGPGSLDAIMGDDAVPSSTFTADVAGRAALLLGVAEGSPQRLSDVVEAAYRHGDARERLAVVRSLALLPDAGRFLPLCLEAGRVNDVDLFAGVACDNPYPARHYPELEFNKLVMKSAFVGLGVARVFGLERRANAELGRMGMEYVDEQESAGRRFSPDIWLAIAPSSAPGAVARMLGYLHHAVEEHRLFAARGLGITKDPRTASFLRQRADLERSEPVLDAVARALADVRGSTSHPDESET